MLVGDYWYCVQALQMAGKSGQIRKRRPVQDGGLVWKASCCLCSWQLMLPEILPGRQNPIRHAAISRFGPLHLQAPIHAHRLSDGLIASTHLNSLQTLYSCGREGK